MHGWPRHDPNISPRSAEQQRRVRRAPLHSKGTTRPPARTEYPSKPRNGDGAPEGRYAKTHVATPRSNQKQCGKGDAIAGFRPRVSGRDDRRTQSRRSVQHKSENFRARRNRHPNPTAAPVRRPQSPVLRFDVRKKRGRSHAHRSAGTERERSRGVVVENQGNSGSSAASARGQGREPADRGQSAVDPSEYAGVSGRSLEMGVMPQFSPCDRSCRPFRVEPPPRP